MINQNSDESIADAVAMERDTRQKPKHGKLATFIWRRESSQEINSRQECKKEDASDTARVQTEHRFKTAASTSSKVSFGFFRNIKKYLQIKNLCRSKQKNRDNEASSPSHSTNQDAIISVVGPIVRSCNSCQEQEYSNGHQDVLSNRLSLYESRSNNTLDNSYHNTEENVDNIIMQCSSVTGTNLNIVPILQQNESICNIATVNDAMMQPCSNVIVEVPSAIAEVSCDMKEMTSNDSKVKASLAEELLNLSKYGWYWGPISVDQADAKLISEPDGAFLVRDSSDDRYVLTLSFKSSGKMLHARMEHSGGLFSLCNQRENEGFTSVAALINHSMNFSQSAVFCYSRPRYPGYPSFPVRLTKPVSRFTQVKSLQYLCRFVIRQNTSLDNIHKLPLPETIKLYILEAHY